MVCVEEQEEEVLVCLQFCRVGSIALSRQELARDCIYFLDPPSPLYSVALVQPPMVNLTASFLCI